MITQTTLISKFSVCVRNWQMTHYPFQDHLLKDWKECILNQATVLWWKFCLLSGWWKESHWIIYWSGCLKDSWKINLNGILNSLLIVSKVENHLWWPQGNSNISHSSIPWSEYSWTATSSQQFDLFQQCIRQGLCYYSLPSPVFIQ